MLVFLPYCGIRWRYADHKKQDTVKFKDKYFVYLEDKAPGILNRLLQIPNLVRFCKTKLGNSLSVGLNNLSSMQLAGHLQTES